MLTAPLNFRKVQSTPHMLASSRPGAGVVKEHAGFGVCAGPDEGVHDLLTLVAHHNHGSWPRVRLESPAKHLQINLQAHELHRWCGDCARGVPLYLCPESVHDGLV